MAEAQHSLSKNSTDHEMLDAWIHLCEQGTSAARSNYRYYMLHGEYEEAMLAIKCIMKNKVRIPQYKLIILLMHWG